MTIKNAEKEKRPTRREESGWAVIDKWLGTQEARMERRNKAVDE